MSEYEIVPGMCVQKNFRSFNWDGRSLTNILCDLQKSGLIDNNSKILNTISDDMYFIINFICQDVVMVHIFSDGCGNETASNLPTPNVNSKPAT